MRMHTRIMQGLERGDGLEACPAAASPFLLDTEDARVPHPAHPLLPSHRTGPASRPAPPSLPVLVLTSICSKRAAVAEESPRAGDARRGTTQEGQGTSREAKPCSEVLMQHCLPEKPPCLCPGVNEPEIIRADSHLAAVCGYLLLEQPLRRQVPAQVLPSGSGKEFEGEIFSLPPRALLSGTARPCFWQGRQVPGTAEAQGPVSSSLLARAAPVSGCMEGHPFLLSLLLLQLGCPLPCRNECLLARVLSKRLMTGAAAKEVFVLCVFWVQLEHCSRSKQEVPSEFYYYCYNLMDKIK